MRSVRQRTWRSAFVCRSVFGVCGLCAAPNEARNARASPSASASFLIKRYLSLPLALSFPAASTIRSAIVLMPAARRAAAAWPSTWRLFAIPMPVRERPPGHACAQFGDELTCSRPAVQRHRLPARSGYRRAAGSGHLRSTRISNSKHGLRFALSAVDQASVAPAPYYKLGMQGGSPRAHTQRRNSMG